jgi:hypothetical protein
MALKGSRKGKGKARAQTPASVIYRCLTLDWDCVKGFISEHIHGLIPIYNVCGVNDERAWDLLYDTIFLGPVTTHHISKFQLMWPHRRSRSLPFQEWWAAFRSYMGQMFDITCDEMSNWRWDNPRGFRDPVDHSNPQTTRYGKVKCTGERFSWYSSDDLRAMIVLPSCRQYKPGDLRAVRPLNWDEIIDKDDDDDNWADPGVRSGGRSRPGDGNDNDDGESEEDMQRGEKGTGKWKGTKNGKGKGIATGNGKGNGNGKGKGNGQGKGTIKHTPGGDDISCAIALLLQKELSEADLDTEG